MKVDETTLSSAITTEGITPNKKFFAKLGSKMAGWLERPLASAGNLIRQMKEGAIELVRSIRNGSFGKIFGQWAKDDPIGAAAGTVAAGLAAGAMLIVGGSAVGWVVGSAGAVLGKVGVMGALSSVGGLGGIVSGLLNGAETVYRMDWNQSDESLMEEVKQAINGLYEPAGEFIGRQIAGLIAGTATSPPKVEINVKALALAWSLNEDIRQDLLQNVSELAYIGMQTFQTIGIKLALLHGRRGIKKLWEKAPDTVKNLIPGLDDKIKKWGEEGSKPWSFESAVNEKIEKISNEKIRNAAEGLLSGFWQQFSSSIQYTYY